MTRIAGFALTLIFVAAFNSCAYAADWEINPRLEGGYLYDNNYRLATPENEIEVSGALADAAIELKTTTPLVEFSLTPRARATYFPDARDENSEDYLLGLAFERRGQKGQGAFLADYALEDVVTSEQPTSDIDSGLGEPSVGEGGRVLIHNRRQLISARPRLSMQAAPRHALLFDARYVDVRYDQQIPGVQVGYTDSSLGLGYAFDVSTRSTLTTRAHASRYDIDVGENKSDATALEFEWSMETSETTRSFVRVGAQRTEIDQLLLDPISGAILETEPITETSWLAGAGVRWAAGLTDLFFDVTRSVGPTSAGFIVARDQLRFRLDRRVGPRFSFFTGARGIYDEAVDEQSLYQGRSYATADIGFQWRMLQQLSMVVSADYTWQEFRDDPATDASSSGAALTFLYEPRRRD